MISSWQQMCSVPLVITFCSIKLQPPKCHDYQLRQALHNQVQLPTNSAKVGREAEQHHRYSTLYSNPLFTITALSTDQCVSKADYLLQEFKGIWVTTPTPLTSALVFKYLFLDLSLNNTLF